MRTILLVEGQVAERAQLNELLSAAGFVVRELEKRSETCLIAQEIRPLAVVLGMRETEVECLELCRRFKGDPLLRSTPVLLLTDRDHGEEVLAALHAGADDYVARDAAPEIIVARVRRLAHDRQMTLMAALNQQLAQVGRLLAGIIHEIRGPVSVIRGNAEVLQLTRGHDDEIRRFTEPIIRNSQILQIRLEHLMATVRGGASTCRPTEIAAVVREAAGLFLKSTDPRHSHLSVNTLFAKDLPPVKADPGRLIQVLMNLLGNAQEAILSLRDSGCIEIRTEVKDQPPERWVTVEVSDDGPGIPEAYVGRIFEPFFTTKAEGTGYGLYLASEILREHGGRLTANNRPGSGACFTLWLPVNTELQSQEGESRETAAVG